jgi:hypothetical protein
VFRQRLKGIAAIADGAFLTATPQNPTLSRLWLAKSHELWPV